MKGTTDEIRGEDRRSRGFDQAGPWSPISLVSSPDLRSSVSSAVESLLESLGLCNPPGSTRSVDGPGPPAPGSARFSVNAFETPSMRRPQVLDKTFQVMVVLAILATGVRR